MSPGPTIQQLAVPGPHGPVTVRCYRPARAGWWPGLLWLHGGAFDHGDLDMAEADLVALSLASAGVLVVSADYRLAVEGVRFPVPHDDCWAAWCWLRSSADALGVDPSRVAVGGASAGACLAASVALRGRDAGAPAWRAVLAYPVVHAWLPDPGDELAEALVGLGAEHRRSPQRFEGMITNYLGRAATPPVDPYAFPGEASDVRGFPPTLIENDEFDELRASGERFAVQLRDAGVRVDQTTARGVRHGHLNRGPTPQTLASHARYAHYLTTCEANRWGSTL